MQDLLAGFCRIRKKESGSAACRKQTSGKTKKWTDGWFQKADEAYRHSKTTKGRNWHALAFVLLFW